MKKIQRNIIWKDRKRIIFGLPWTFTRYSLTEDRLFIETGFFNVREDEVRLYRILDVSLKITFFQRIFGIGTIHCCSADKSMGDFDIKRIKNPRMVKELLSEAIEKERMAKRVTNREYMEHEGSDEDFNDDEDRDGPDDDR